MAHSKKEPWEKPEIRRFTTPEEVLEYYGSKASPAELRKLEDLLEQMRKTRRDLSGAMPRRKANG